MQGYFDEDVTYEEAIAEIMEEEDCDREEAERLYADYLQAEAEDGDWRKDAGDRWREQFILSIMKRQKVGRERAEAIYAKREARHGDFQWRVVGHVDLDEK